MLTEEIEDMKILRKEFQEFAMEEIVPFANDWDKSGKIPHELVQKMAIKGYLGATIPGAFGGRGMSQTAYGILNEEIGRACSSVRSLITVHSSLVAETILRWGTKEQKSYWLPLLASGNKIAAFGLSEPEIGSDAKNVHTTYLEMEEGFLINGNKKWITFGQIADVLLVAAKNDKGMSTFLVDTKTKGVVMNPIENMMGTRASMLAEYSFENVFVVKECLLGMKGMGFMQIINTALDNGRFSVGCGSLGIAKACLEESIKYAKTRKQGGVNIGDYQLIKQKITKMIVNVKAAKLLCENASALRDVKSPNAIIQTSLAKYFASKAATENSTEAVQLHGAMGCFEGLSIQRYFRDARVMEIIEGSSEIQQILIADHGMSSLSSIID